VGAAAIAMLKSMRNNTNVNCADTHGFGLAEYVNSTHLHYINVPITATIVDDFCEEQMLAPPQ
jgi:hypothetical protein